MTYKTKQKSMPSKDGHTEIPYANDTVLISNSLKGLQRHLNALKVFCTDKILSINIDKI